jgi:hypothetical protein
MTPALSEDRFSPLRPFLLTTLANTVWINASEIFRYFGFIQSMMRDAFPQVPDIVPMNLPVFLIWGVWDMLIVVTVTGFTWLYLERFGQTTRNALAAGTLVWGAVFVVLWLGIYNMNLATLPILAVALPMSWLELLVGALITKWGMARFGATV